MSHKGAPRYTPSAERKKKKKKNNPKLTTSNTEPARSSLRIEEEINNFPDQQMLQKFITTKLA